MRRRRFALIYNRVWGWLHQPLWGPKIDYHEDWEATVNTPKPPNIEDAPRGPRPWEPT